MSTLNVCEFCNVEFKKKNKKQRFCSVKCVNDWQKTIRWEDRVGEETAERIRKEVSLRTAGEKNPTKNPKVAKKVSESLSKYLKENPELRAGNNNPFHGRKHTSEYKEKHSQNKKGKWAYNHNQYLKLLENTPRKEKHPNWLGGISFLPYCPKFDKKLKNRIKNKYRNMCSLCKISNVMLVVHHIDYDKKNSSENNLIPLCESCHGKTNFNREIWSGFFKCIQIWK